MTESTTAALATALKVLFWCSLAAEVAWLALSASAWEAVTSFLGVKGQGIVHLVILGGLALFSGLLWNSPARADTLTLRDASFFYFTLLEVGGTPVAKR